MAMSVTITDARNEGITKIKFEWTSETNSATGTTTDVYSGQVLELVTDPGSAAPTDNYDVTITDADGVDVLAGQGADRDTANTEYVIHSDSTPLGVVADSQLTLSIGTAGDAKTGTVYLYLGRR
jgi:hypothetical protein